MMMYTQMSTRLLINSTMYLFQPDRYLLKKQVHDVAHYVRGRVLDVGAGTSDRYSGSFAFDEYVRMEVMDGPGIDVVGTAYEIPLPASSFDTVVSTQVFEHLASPEVAAKECARVLKPGGHILITVPQMNELHEEPHDYFRYTSFGLVHLLTTAGFEVVHLEQRGGYYATLAQLRIRHWIDTYRLYDRPLLGRIVGKWCLLYGRFMLFLDVRHRSVASRKHTIGWCIVGRKR